jgi:formamidopyrimidine-DNA glycosylase
MPELPEVETIKRQLERLITGKRLAGKEIKGLRRRAKILIVDFNDGSSLIFHLKMTGQLIFNGQPGPHTRHIFKFDDGSQLVFNDMRKFGWWKKIQNTEILEKSFGPEANRASLDNFKKIASKRPKAKIKQLLMDQKMIAGIGNIYSDEILFASKVHPFKLAGKLKAEEIRKIWKNTKTVLEKAILLHGTSERNYLDAFGQKGSYLSSLRVYGKEGERCFKCPGKIKRVKIGGRSAYFCPKCQKI